MCLSVTRLQKESLVLLQRQPAGSCARDRQRAEGSAGRQRRRVVNHDRLLRCARAGTLRQQRRRCASPQS
jgi:hypothetical protein